MGILLVSQCKHALPGYGAQVVCKPRLCRLEEWHVHHTCCMRLGVLVMLQLLIRVAVESDCYQGTSCSLQA